MSVVFFGEALYDIYSDAPPSDPLKPLLLRANIGGGVLNAAIAAARWRQSTRTPLPVHFIGGISRDNLGARIVALLQREGVEVSRCIRSDANTALALVFNDADGERSFRFYRHRSADLEYPAKQWRKEWFRDMRLFACDTNCMTTKEIFYSNMVALRYARARQIPIAMDVNLRPALWTSRVRMRACIRKALPYATIIKCSEEELSLLCDGADESARRGRLFALPSRTPNRRILCISRGKEGCSIYFADSARKAIEIAAPSTAVRDTTGAGDAFFGAFCAFLTAHSFGVAGKNDGRGDAHDHDERSLLRRAATDAVAFATRTVQYQGALRYPVSRARRGAKI